MAKRKTSKQKFLEQCLAWIEKNTYTHFMYAAGTHKDDIGLSMHIFAEVARESIESDEVIFDIEYRNCTKRKLIKYVVQWFKSSFDSDRKYELSIKDVYAFSLIRKALPAEAAEVERILNPPKRKTYKRSDRPKWKMSECITQKPLLEGTSVEQKVVGSKLQQSKQKGLIHSIIPSRKESGRRRKKEYDWSSLKELYIQYGSNFSKIATIIGCSAAAVRRRIILGQM